MQNKKQFACKSESGAVMLIEAAFVFPIMFIVLFILLMLGEAYFQHARITRLVTTQAITSAAYCENPMLETVVENETTPSYPTSADYIKPYRYLFSGWGGSDASTQENVALDGLQSSIESLTAWGFAGVKITNVNVTTEYEQSLLISHFIIQCDYSVQLPIRMLFSEENFTVDFSVHVEQPVGDPAEFVRNVSLVQDYLERVEGYSEFTEKITKAIEPVANFLN